MTLQPDSPRATLHLFHVKLRSILGAETTFKQKLEIKLPIKILIVEGNLIVEGKLICVWITVKVFFYG